MGFVFHIERERDPCVILWAHFYLQHFPIEIETPNVGYRMIGGIGIGIGSMWDIAYIIG